MESLVGVVTAVTTPTNDTTPDYTFSSDEAGTITYGGSCSSSTTIATTGNNTITLVSLSDGTYSNCTITVTENAENSVTLNISSFVIDTTSPTVSSTTPADNANTIAVNLPITATFSDYLDNSTVNTTNFFLKDNSSNLITSTVSYTDKIATLTPTADLSRSLTYFATIKSGISDLAGNKLGSDYSWSFMTGDFTAPIVAEVTAVTTPTSDTTPIIVQASP